jgi:ankyrin repeat protein
MDFYKILNKEEKHYDLQYQTGLNIDPVQFDPSGNCKPGGIYFAKEDILAFLGYGSWIRKVTLPENAQVYENPGEPKKWKADRVILGEREYIDGNVIKRLIKEGANPTVNNSYPLQITAKQGNVEAVKVLLEAGADPSADDSLALQWAAEKGNIEIIKMLLEKGVDPKADDSCALVWAAGDGHLETVKLLLEAGADPTSCDSQALRWAAQRGHIEIVKLLLEAGADPKADDSRSLLLAVENEHIEIVKLLLPLSEITEYLLKYVGNNYKNQEIQDLIYNNYKKGNVNGLL